MKFDTKRYATKFDIIVIGAGISGLTAASLLAKRGLKVAVIDKSYNPGGSCGIFKRGQVVFDQGSAMLYGFGEKGFNAHRFVFNCLEESIDIIKHDLLYCVNFKGHRIRFWQDLGRFTDELGDVFPSERDNIKRFYKDMDTLYHHVMVENPAYTTADETDPQKALKSVSKHPISYIRFLSYLNKDAETLLRKYFKDPEIFKFFDKLTSTYCYATVKEAPAILAAVMFVDNHAGGSYYPAGSTMFLPGKLEKVIEENSGEMFMEREAEEILFEEGKPCGVRMKDGSVLYGDHIIYSGTVWNLYGKMIRGAHLPPGREQWAAGQVPTYPSVVLYAHVGKEAIPEDTHPIEMLVGNPDCLDESEVTVYIFSIDDHTLCEDDSHVVMAIGPTFENWEFKDPLKYKQMKDKERERLLTVLEKRFPGFTRSVRHAEVGTPRTIERYTHKNGGAVAGPKQMLGQHMFKRLHTKSEWDNLFFCGESTVMGTGTPTVTTEGLSAANAILKKLGQEPFEHWEGMQNYVRMVQHPFKRESLYSEYPEKTRSIMLKALRCQFCQNPACMKDSSLDIRGILRRVAVGNFIGADRLLRRGAEGKDPIAYSTEVEKCREMCIQKASADGPVEIKQILEYVHAYVHE